MKSAPLVGLKKGNSPPSRLVFYVPFFLILEYLQEKHIGNRGKGADKLSPAPNIHGYHLLRLMAGSGLELLSPEKKRKGETGTRRFNID